MFSQLQISDYQQLDSDGDHPEQGDASLFAEKRREKEALLAIRLIVQSPHFSSLLRPTGHTQRSAPLPRSDTVGDDDKRRGPEGAAAASSGSATVRMQRRRPRATAGPPERAALGDAARQSQRGRRPSPPGVATHWRRARQPRCGSGGLVSLRGDGWWWQQLPASRRHVGGSEVDSQHGRAGRRAGAARAARRLAG